MWKSRSFTGKEIWAVVSAKSQENNEEESNANSVEEDKEEEQEAGYKESTDSKDSEEYNAEDKKGSRRSFTCKVL